MPVTIELSRWDFNKEDWDCWGDFLTELGIPKEKQDWIDSVTLEVSSFKTSK